MQLVADLVLGQVVEARRRSHLEKVAILTLSTYICKIIFCFRVQISQTAFGNVCTAGLTTLV
jgi:hypothetical protein